MADDALITDRTDNFTASARGVAGAVLLVNLFTPKAGMADAFVEAQTSEYVRLRGRVPGWVGNRLGRSVDGTHLVNVALFDTLASYDAWRESALFVEHLEVIRPFVERSAPGMYEVLYSAGEM
jgi:heme-degrading monooxygenase HmoA